MNRRADRTMAASAIAAVTIVPLVLLAVLNTGAANPAEAGDLPAAQTADQPPDPLQSKHAEVPAAASGAPGGPGGARAQAPAPTAGAAQPDPDRDPRPLAAYTRVTTAELADDSGSEHATETMHVVLTPEFSFDAVGERRSTSAGETTEHVQRVRLNGRRLSTHDGAGWRHTELTADQLTALRSNADPRRFTYIARSVPGVDESTDESGATRFRATGSVGDLLDLLPADVAAQIEQRFSRNIGVAVDLRADPRDRPLTVGLATAELSPGLTVSMRFTGYR